MCFYQLCRLRQIRRLVGRQEAAQQLASAFILSRIDYCNSVLAGLPNSTIEPLQLAQNASVRFVLNLCLREHVMPALNLLQWLPVTFQIRYKVSY